MGLVFLLPCCLPIAPRTRPHIILYLKASSCVCPGPMETQSEFALSVGRKVYGTARSQLITISQRSDGQVNFTAVLGICCERDLSSLTEQLDPVFVPG